MVMALAQAAMIGVLTEHGWAMGQFSMGKHVKTVSNGM
jgi:hypothetical protein